MSANTLFESGISGISRSALQGRQASNSIFLNKDEVGGTIRSDGRWNLEWGSITIDIKQCGECIVKSR